MVITALKTLVENPVPLREEIKGEVNLFEAARTHMTWRFRLHEYLEGLLQEKLDHEYVCKDDQCVLGKWIHGQGKARFGNLSMFRELVDDHAALHLQAAKVLEVFQSGDKDRAREILMGEYSQTSKKAISSLTKLYMYVENAERDKDHQSL